jgi:hypothetical protein
MQMDAKYNAVKQSRCITRVITALRSSINKTVSSRCDPKPGSLTGNAVQFSVGRLIGKLTSGLPVTRERSLHPPSLGSYFSAHRKLTS